MAHHFGRGGVVVAALPFRSWFGRSIHRAGRTTDAVLADDILCGTKCTQTVNVQRSSVDGASSLALIHPLLNTTFTEHMLVRTFRRLLCYTEAYRTIKLLVRRREKEFNRVTLVVHQKNLTPHDREVMRSKLVEVTEYTLNDIGIFGSAC
jgi:hypothetical protein